MKSLKILLIISLTISQSSFSQKPEKPSKLKLTKSAQQLFKTYDEILQNEHEFICDFPPKMTANNPIEIKRKYKWGLMDAKDYASSGKGKLSFLSFVWTSYKNDMLSDEQKRNATKPFRTSWWNSEEDVKKYFEAAKCQYYGPEKFYYPFDKNNDNQSYQILLVPIKTYKSEKLKLLKFESDTLGIPIGKLADKAMDVNDIKEIKKVYLEKKYGYMHFKHKAQFKTKNSSIGVICDVLTVKDEVLKCYVFNNYNDLIRWKN
jgi:hypothetical protein